MSDQLDLDFENFDAGLYSFEQAVGLFIPNRVWDQIRQATSQVLYGGIGTGKTLLMKRLSWPAMLSNSSYLANRRFAAFYMDMRCLADLVPVCSDLIFPLNEFVRKSRLQVAGCLGTLHLLQVIAETITAISSGADEASIVEDALLQAGNYALANVHSAFGDRIALGSFLAKTKERLSACVSSPSRFQYLADFAKSTTFPEQTFRIFCNHARKYTPLRFGVLVDQYEWIPWECRPVFNQFLRRQNSDLSSLLSPHVVLLSFRRTFLQEK